MNDTIIKNVSKKFLNSISKEGLKEFKKIHEFYVKNRKFKSDKLEKLAYKMMKDIYTVLHANSDKDLDGVIFAGGKVPPPPEGNDDWTPMYVMMKDLWHCSKNPEFRTKFQETVFGMIFLNGCGVPEFLSKYMSDELKDEISK